MGLSHELETSIDDMKMINMIHQPGAPRGSQALPGPHAGGPICNILSASLRLPKPVPCNGELGCWPPGVRIFQSDSPRKNLRRWWNLWGKSGEQTLTSLGHLGNMIWWVIDGDLIWFNGALRDLILIPCWFHGIFHGLHSWRPVVVQWDFWNEVYVWGEWEENDQL